MARGAEVIAFVISYQWRAALSQFWLTLLHRLLIHLRGFIRGGAYWRFYGKHMRHSLDPEGLWGGGGGRGLKGGGSCAFKGSMRLRKF